MRAPPNPFRLDGIPSAFLRNDGRAVVNLDGVECIAPELEEDIDYIDFSAGSDIALFLRSDGQIVQVST